MGVSVNADDPFLNWFGNTVPFLNWLKYFRGQTCSSTYCNVLSLPANIERCRLPSCT